MSFSVNNAQLHFGTPVSTPLELFHGMEPVRTHPIAQALKIIKSEKLIPGGHPSHTDSNCDQRVFQHIAANLSKQEFCDLRENQYSDLRISGMDYLQRNQEQDPTFTDRVYQCHNVAMRRFETITNYTISDALTSEDPRTRTTCFTERYGGFYNSHLTFHFSLNEEQVTALNQKNFAGTTFFRHDCVRATAELPLTYCTNIILGEQINPSQKELIVNELKKALKQRNLTHIEVKSGHRNMEEPKEKLSEPLGFELPYEIRVKITNSQMVKLKISCEDQKSIYEEFSDSTFEFEMCGDNWYITRHKLET